MSKKNVAINGFGRIGRVTLRILLNHTDKFNIVAINDLTDSKTLAHLFKYDSVHGTFNGTVSHAEKSININGNEIKCYAEKDPSVLPWKYSNIDYVLECTGLFLSKDKAELHLQAGAKKVILSAPAKGDDIKSVVMGVNDYILRKDDVIISNASCTTNCAAPMVKVLLDKFKMESCFISTVHSYTGDQRLHDSPHKDLRRARAAALSIIPTSTGAAKAITKIFPHMEGKIGGAGIRVPVPNGSLTDMTCIINGTTSVEEVNAAFKAAADSNLKGILEYAIDPIVSSDIVGNPHSCIFDPELTSVIGNMVKVVGWYDNEYGYSNRLVDLLIKLNSL